MSNIPTKTTTPIAVSNYTELNLNSSHVTTSNFMELSVAKSMELVPKQSLDVYHNTFTRLEPLPVPTFGLAKIHNKSFFVPYRTIFPAWNDFINDVAHTYPDGTIQHVPSVPTGLNSVFVNFLRLADCSLEAGPDADLDKCDFVYITDNGDKYGVPIGYNFTPFGRRCFKILTSLGYAFSFNAYDEDTLHSLLPLFSFLKVYLDWYFPNNYVQTDLYFNVEALLKYDKVEPMYDNFNILNLLQIFQLIDKVSYDSDYFVSSWDNPVAPNDGSYSNMTIIDTTQPNSTQVAATTSLTEDGTPVIPHQQNNSISQFMLNSLRAVNDYLSRHRIVGARVIDRYLSRWGIVLDAAKLDRSLRLNAYNQEVRFGDVTATADTDGANLGSYAGKAVSDGDGYTQYQNGEEYGHFLILSSIVPETAYYQGRDRTTQHITKLDFYTPEFDNLGVQALATTELFMPTDARKMYGEGSQFGLIDSSEKVFSFIPRYGEYKRSYNVLSGDYRLNSKNAGKDAWTLFRNVDSYFKANGMNTKHSVDFVLGNDSQQYSRIFYNTADNADHFNVIHNFHISTRFPGKSLFDTYEFENEDESPKVTVDAGGVKSN